MQYRSLFRPAQAFFALASSVMPLAAGCGSEEAYAFESYDLYDVLRSPTRVEPDAPRFAEVAILVDTDQGRVRVPADSVGVGGARLTGVPAGPATWELVYADALEDEPPSRVYVDVVSRRLFHGARFAARPEVAAAGEGTRVALVVPAVEAWSVAADHVEIVSSLADVWVRAWSMPDDPDSQSNAPAEGATSLAGWETALASMDEPYLYGPRLVDATRGDDLRVVHVRTEPLGHTADPADPWSGAETERVLGSFEASATYADGATTTLEGTFERAPEVAYDVDFRAAAFVDAWGASGAPEDVSQSAQFYVVFEPGEGPGYTNGVAPTLLSVGSARTIRDIDDQLVAHPGDVALSLSYGQPYTFVGRAVASASVGLWYRRQDPVSGTPEFFNANFGVTDLADALASAPIVPAVSQVTNLRIAGQPAAWDAALEPVGVTPMVSWDPPATGAATHYEIAVSDTTDVGSRLRREFVRVYTERTSFTFPEGVLLEGRYYFARVRAVSDGGSLDEPTVLASDRRAIADVLTGFFTP